MEDAEASVAGVERDAGEEGGKRVPPVIKQRAHEKGQRRHPERGAERRGAKMAPSRTKGRGQGPVEQGEAGEGILRAKSEIKIFRKAAGPERVQRLDRVELAVVNDPPVGVSRDPDRHKRGHLDREPPGTFINFKPNAQARLP